MKNTGLSPIQQAAPALAKPFDVSLAFYRTRHRSPGCRITHLFGVPLIGAGIMTLLFPSLRRSSLTFLGCGVFLQLLGHYAFEKNEPTLRETHDLMSIPASLFFVFELWREVFSGEWSQNNSSDLWEKRKVSPHDLQLADSMHVQVKGLQDLISDRVEREIRG
jgi:hypothetical protein